MASVCRRPAELASQCGAACSSQVPREALLFSLPQRLLGVVKALDFIDLCFLAAGSNDYSVGRIVLETALVSTASCHPSSPSAWVTPSRGAQPVVARVTSPRCHRDRPETGSLAPRTRRRGTREARRRDLDSRPMDADGRVPSRFTALRMLDGARCRSRPSATSWTLVGARRSGDTARHAPPMLADVRLQAFAARDLDRRRAARRAEKGQI
jgi:hypothetical protein